MRYVDIYPGMGSGQQWGFLQDSNGTTRPSATNNGVVVTPGTNAFGAYANVLTLTQDAYWLEIIFQANAVSGQARDTTVNISTDGGSTILAPALGAAGAGNLVDGPITYHFPLWVRSGTVLSAAASVNNGTVGTLGCRIRAYGKPRSLRNVRAGRFVRSFGVTAASSSGTVVVSGQAAEGAYTNIGAVTAEPLWWWQTALFYNNAASNNFINFLDVAVNDGIADRIVIADQYWQTDTGEYITNQPYMQGEYHAPKGVQVKARMQSSGAIGAETSIAVYGVGG